MSLSPWIWFAALLTLCTFSFLWRDNPFYKFAEHLFVGVSVGYTIAILYWNAFLPRVWEPIVINHQFYILLPTILGILSFAIFFKKISWLIRYPIAFIMGAGCGISVPRSFQGYIFRHMQGTITAISPGQSNLLLISNIIMVIGVIATLLYFYFSIEHKGFIGKVANVGIWYIMLAFGAGFGYTVMARVSLLIGRLQFLLHDWLGVID
ncbi:hypothetical protein KAT73_03010 [candidate division WOR-3 bacterium]|nr:hypothetical protein [candidate division WOR-3 bacterium]